MSSEGNKPEAERFSLKRWSQRKLDAARSSAPSQAKAVEPVPAPAPVDEPVAEVVPPAPAAFTPTAPELPAVESLTLDSDFSAFLQPKVDEVLKRKALRKLFADPHFNVMDGLDVYIDDYSVPSPLEPELLAQLLHARFTLNPPKTRIDAQGRVEEIPPEEVSAAEELNPQATPAQGAALANVADERSIVPNNRPAIGEPAVSSPAPPDEHR